MKVQEKNVIVERLIEELEKMPDGSRTSTLMLMGRCGYGEEWAYDDRLDDLCSIHRALFRKAEKYGIYLDMSAHSGLAEGYPCFLDFIVKKDSKES